MNRRSNIGLEQGKLELATTKLNGPEAERYYAELLSIFGLTREKIDSTIGQNVPISKVIIDYLTHDAYPENCIENKNRARIWDRFAEAVVGNFRILTSRYNFIETAEAFGMDEAEAFQAIIEMSRIGIILLQYLADQVGEEMIDCLSTNAKAHIENDIIYKTDSGLTLMTQYLESPEETMGTIEEYYENFEVNINTTYAAEPNNENMANHKQQVRVDSEKSLRERRWNRLAIVLGNNIEMFARDENGSLGSDRNMREMLEFFNITMFDQLRNAIVKRTPIGQILLQYFTEKIANWLIADIRIIMGEKGNALIKELQPLTHVGMDSVTLCIEKAHKLHKEGRPLRELVYASAIEVTLAEEKRIKHKARMQRTDLFQPETLEVMMYRKDL
ncbi:MAG: hypothetical protein WCT36_04695 [Candidatus Gracilibacteria bacterium]|jgi:hypothetical protein